jgi:hypothetical protein
LWLGRCLTFLLGQGGGGEDDQEQQENCFHGSLALRKS